MFELDGYSLSGEVHASRNSIIERGTRDAEGAAVVIKRPTEKLPSPGRIARLKREFEMTQQAAGDGVVDAIEFVHQGTTVALVFGDSGGASLSSLLNDRELTIAETLAIGARVAEALARVHRARVIHKDVNPSNIVWNAGADDVQLIDFGISTELTREQPEVLNPNRLEGTLAYMSPEQTGRMNRALDYRTDLYSLGATLYRLLTGSLPFEGKDSVELVHCHIAKVPTPVHEANADVPRILSDLVARLMSKTAENRYQSALAVADDLRTCAQQLAGTGTIEAFELGTTDLSDRFQIPQKLYGRDIERRKLLQSFGRAAAGGRETLLVAGYSGIGKSALVHEVHRPIVEQRGQFVEGKFDQFNRNIPYASLIQAFRELVRQILTEPEDVLQGWRERVQEAVGPNGQVIVDVISEVELIIGEQGPVPPLPPAEALNRFNVVFESFVRTFADADHPLALFLDDLQWADLPSLQLVQRFMTDPENTHILLIGAYRDNEVDEGHPLLLTLEEMRKAGGSIGTITLPPLSPGHVAELLADTLGTGPGEVASLTKVCVDKTGGNPFFLNQFLLALYEGGSIDFDADRRAWTWDLDKIEGMGITDNVVDLMARKIRALPEASQASLTVAATVGNTFDLRTMSIAMQTEPLAAGEALQSVLEEGLIVPVGGNWKFLAAEDASEVVYRFLHDRVQQAAYSLIDEVERTARHRELGRLLLTHLDEDERADRLFEIVNHLNRALDGITDAAEREELSRLNLEAGRRAKASAAFKPALEYLQAGIELAGDDVWERDYDLALALYLAATESTYQTSEFDLMEEYAALVEDKAAHALLDRVLIAEIRIQAYISQNRLAEAVDNALIVLAELGVTFPEDPQEADVVAAIGATMTAIGGRSPDELYDAAEMQDPEKLAAMRMLQKITSATYVARPALFPLVPMKGVELSASLGNTGASTYAYACFGIILAGVVGDIPAAYGMGQLAVRLVDKFGAREYEARTKYIDACYVRHWCRHTSETWKDFAPVYQIGLDTGDLEFSGWSLMMGSFHAFYSGRPLTETEPETKRWLAAIEQVGQVTALGYAEAGYQAMRCLRGMNENATRLDDPESGYDQDERLKTHVEAADAFGVANLLFNRMLLCFLFGDYEQAEEIAGQLDPWFPAMVATIHVPTVILTDALFRIELAQKTDDAERKAELVGRANADLEMLTKWGEAAPMNHEHKALMVRGQLARLEGDVAAARTHLKAAADSAGEHENLFEQALALELLGRLWREVEDEPEMGALVLRHAHHLYLLWGASAKARQLVNEYGADVISGRRGRAGSTYGSLTYGTTTTTTTGTSGGLDLESVLKANQTLSGEVELSKLLGKMMDIVLENGGAEYGALLLDDEGHLRLEARDVADTPGVTVLESMPLDQAVEHRLVPGSIVNYCARTTEPVVLDDGQDSRFGQDPYVASKGTRSILCTPLLHQGKLIGVLYLENNLAPGAFTEDRIEVLDLLIGQSAVALDNARLFEHQRRLTESFRRFVPQQFLQHLGRDRVLDIELGDSVGEDLTVMFTDLRGFTSLSEGMTAEENIALLNDYLARMEPCIEENGGFVDNFIGDAIMALFPGDPANAVRSAVAMCDALRTMNDGRQAAGEAPLAMGIGIHSGPVMLGTVGSSTRLETTVIGDTVNLASRLEGLTKHYDSRVLISDVTADKLSGNTFHLRDVGRVRVKGKAAAVGVHEVLDGEAPGLREEKLGVMTEFATARDAYFSGDWSTAADAFTGILAGVPRDGAAKFYAERAQRAIERGGHDATIGVEVLDAK